MRLLSTVGCLLAASVFERKWGSVASFFQIPPGKDEEGKARKEECIAKLQGVCVHGACFAGSFTVPSCKESRKESCLYAGFFFRCVFSVNGYYFYSPVSCLAFVKIRFRLLRTTLAHQTCGLGFFRTLRPRGRPRRRSRLALGASGAARRGWPGRRQCGALG